MNLLRRWSKSGSLARDTVAIATGTAAAQFISILTAPILTRLFDPEQFGTYGSFIALVALLGPVSALCYPAAIVLPKDESEAAMLSKLSLHIAAASAAVAFLLLLFFGAALDQVIQFGAPWLLVCMLPIAVYASAYVQVAQSFRVRERLFAIAARVAFLHSILLNGAKVLVGFTIPIAPALVIVSVLGIALNGLMLRSTQSRRPIQEPELTLLGTAQKHLNFPLYVMPDSILGAITKSAPVIILATCAGPAAAGFYALTNTVVRLPGTLISGSVRDAVYPRLAKIHNQGEPVTPLLVRSTLVVAVVTLVPFATLAIFAPFLFQFAFGQEWIVAGQFAQWAAVAMFFTFVNSPSARAVAVLGQQRAAFVVRVVSVLLSVGAMPFLFAFGIDVLTVVALHFLVRAVSYGFLTVYTIAASRKAGPLLSS